MKSTGFLKTVSSLFKKLGPILTRGTNSKCLSLHWTLAREGAFTGYRLFLLLFVPCFWEVSLLLLLTEFKACVWFNGLDQLPLQHHSVLEKGENEWISNCPNGQESNIGLFVEAPCNQAAWAGSYRWRLWGSSPALSLHSGCKRVGPGPEMESDEDVQSCTGFEHNLETQEGRAGATCDKSEKLLLLDLQCLGVKS